MTIGLKEKIWILALHLAFGGVEKAIVNMANLFVEQGHPVEILCVYDMPDSPAFPLDPRVKITYLLKDTPNRQQWKESIRSKNPFSIVRESVKAARILLGKKRCVRRAVQSISDGIVITTRHEDSLALSKYGRPGVFKIAQLHHDHRFDPTYVKGFADGYQNIDVFALLTPQLADEVRDIMKDNRHTRIVCIPNFLERIPEQVDASQRKKIVLAVGRLDPVKGFDRLIEAFGHIRDRAPDWQLHIVGEGEEREVLENRIRSLSLEDHVVLTGRKNASEIEQMMKEASLYAMTSHSEGLPFVLIEAFSCGLPAVAYDVRVGPRGVIEDQVSGFLVPDDDEAQFVDQCLKLMEDDPLRYQMSENAYNRAKDFSKEKVGTLWDRILEE
ncbi:glycosyl transferase [Solibaculum mannosilyticum]|uniref:Glycosyl transferase n=1 Tax=Solibaculum mannosilyticum TaxID=2780922 RepID=A0A7I8D266_9FIRM|nr:glycosyl transferase [Solibaculum mannosilyticum]